MGQSWRMRRVTKSPEDFTAFYFRNVATGEGCGCAERVIDVAEVNRLAEARKLPRASLRDVLRGIAGLFRPLPPRD